ncbi:hypothetical protein PMAYCL1PPCAC_16117, partial [Pristionchus mayeri]
MTTLIENLGQWLSPDWDFGYACCRETVLISNALYGILLMLNTAIFALYIYVYSRNKTLHANFRCILIIFAVNDMVLIYQRIADFWLTGVIDRENGFTYFVKMMCWATLIFSLCNVIGERLFALYAYRWYHEAHLRFPTPILLVYIVQEIFVELLIWKGIISKIVMLVCLAIMILLTTIFLIFNFRNSRRRNRKMLARRFQWSDGSCLSRRLRTVEILRENRLLQIFLPYLLISSMVQAVEGIAAMHIITPLDHRYYLVAHCLFYLTISIRVLFDLIIPILAHPVIKADAKKALTSVIK